MLNQPNERIEEIYMEATKNIDDSMKKKSSSGIGCLGPLVLVLIAALVNSVELLGAALVGGVLSIFASSSKANDGGSQDPDFYMPYIMRMVGEILSAEWGEYLYTKEFNAITFNAFPAAASQSEDAQNTRNPIKIHFERDYEVDDDNVTDRREYTVVLKHPLMEDIRRQDDGRIKKELKRNMKLHLYDLGVPATMDRTDDSWAVTYNLKDILHRNLFKIGEFNQGAWFEYAHSIAECTVKIAQRMQRVMNQTQERIPSILLDDRK